MISIVKNQLMLYIYRVLAALIAVFLFVGICMTANNAANFRRYVEMDTFWCTLPYLLLILIIIQLIFIIKVGKVSLFSKSFCVVALSNFISMMFIFILFSVYHMLIFSPGSSPVNGYFKWILLDLLRPSVLVWFPGENIGTILYIVCMTLFTVSAEYFMLKKHTNLKKRLFIVILLTTVFLHTIASLFFKLYY